MFSVPDILVVSVLALLLFGPDRLPKLMRQAGRFMREVQNTSQGFISEMERAADLAEHPAPAPVPANTYGDSAPEDIAGDTELAADLAEHPTVEKAEPPAAEPPVNEHAEHSSNEHSALRNPPPLGGSAM